MIVRVETPATAPPEALFDLARSQRTHVATTGRTRERVVAGPDHDGLELGDEVTFEAIHLGLRWRLTARITEMEPPTRFVDEMVRGPFQAFRHEHRFTPNAMVDVFDFTMPRWLKWSEPFVAWHLRRFLRARGQALHKLAVRKVVQSD
jgi:ligand-binding SRPBCC domain-containing protein